MASPSPSSFTETTESTTGPECEFPFWTSEATEEVGPRPRPASSVMAGGLRLGREVEAFEQEWAPSAGARGGGRQQRDGRARARARRSGAVRAGRGDSSSPPLTAGYTALAILNAGATPVFADINPHTCTLDPKLSRGRHSAHARRRARALYGRWLKWKASLLLRRGAASSSSKTRAVARRERRREARGRARHASAFSFYPTKNLGAYGDGGRSPRTTKPDRGVKSCGRAGTSRRYGASVSEPGSTRASTRFRRRLSGSSSGGSKGGTRAAAKSRACTGARSPVVELSLPADHEPGSHVYQCSSRNTPSANGCANTSRRAASRRSSTTHTCSPTATLPPRLAAALPFAEASWTGFYRSLYTHN